MKPNPAPPPEGSPRWAEAVRLFVASACGLGLLPIAPGSFGALLGVVAHVAVAFWAPPNVQWVSLVLILLAVSAAHIALTPWSQARWHSLDPKNFVLDEVAGYLVVPILFHRGPLWKTAFCGFLLFRILDVIKVPPARQIDRDTHGAWGILLDDIVSGLYAVGCLYAMDWVFLRLSGAPLFTPV